MSVGRPTGGRSLVSSYALHLLEFHPCEIFQSTHGANSFIAEDNGLHVQVHKSANDRHHMVYLGGQNEGSLQNCSDWQGTTEATAPLRMGRSLLYTFFFVRLAFFSTTLVTASPLILILQGQVNILLQGVSLQFKFTDGSVLALDHLSELLVSLCSCLQHGFQTGYFSLGNFLQ
jgi:hypothetical protein